MTQRAKELADKLQAFNERVIAVVEQTAEWMVLKSAAGHLENIEKTLPR